MKVKFISLALCMAFLSGCAMTPQESITYQSKNNFDDKKQLTQGKEYLSVNDLRRMYKEKTGMNLPQQNTASCQDNDKCYYNMYADSFRELMSGYLQKKQLEEIEKEKIAEQNCSSDEACSRDRDLTKLKAKLKNAYLVLIYSNPYLQDGYDGVFRKLCSNSELSQKAGLKKDSWLNEIRDRPGVSPNTRQQALDIASICWDISSLGGNWKEALR